MGEEQSSGPWEFSLQCFRHLPLGTLGEEAKGQIISVGLGVARVIIEAEY